VDRAELAAFLRTRRARLGPGDVGLPSAARRRTPGLRREEVALLAGVSVDYYTRLEQARGPRPSRQVLAALARSLRLTGDERDHLFRLAGEPAPEPQGHSNHVRPGVLHLLDRLADSAVVVVNELGDVLAWTPLTQALFTDYSALPAGERNLYRMFFTGREELHRLLPEDREHAARANVADLRATSARRRDDPAVQRLVAQLRRASPLFERLWATHDVAVRHADRKHILHPTVGLLELDCEVLLMPEHDQRLILHTAPPGSESAEKLQLLRVVGLQQLAPENHSLMADSHSGDWD
jgi:transcriptional regulator with XRE-family HTH domain